MQLYFHNLKHNFKNNNYFMIFIFQIEIFSPQIYHNQQSKYFHDVLNYYKNSLILVLINIEFFQKCIS